MDLDPDVSRFLKHLESERRLSPRTIVSYRKDLEDLRVFLDEHYGGGEDGYGGGSSGSISAHSWGGVIGNDLHVERLPVSCRPYVLFTGSFILRTVCRMIRPGR